MANRIVTVIDNCATIVTTEVYEGARRFYESSYANDGPGSFVRRWLDNGETRQVFGSWSGGNGNALIWEAGADEPEGKARQIGREARLPILTDAEYRAWREQHEAA